MPADYSICPLSMASEFVSKMNTPEESRNECKAYEECERIFYETSRTNKRIMDPQKWCGELIGHFFLKITSPRWGYESMK